MKNQESTRSIVATSFFTGIIIMFVITYWLTGPHYAYSESMEILQSTGSTHLTNGSLIYCTENTELTRQELKALAKLSTIYVIDISMPSYLNINNLDQ